MTDQPLAKLNIAILLANGFAEEEFAATQRQLLSEGANVTVVSMENGLANGWHENGWGHYFPVDKSLSTALAADFDALFVPAGSRHIERLSGQAHAARFLRGFVDGEKPMVLNGEAARLLMVAERSSGRTVVSDHIDATAAAEANLTLAEDSKHTDRNLVTTANLSVPEIVEATVEHFHTAEEISEAA